MKYLMLTFRWRDSYVLGPELLAALWAHCASAGRLRAHPEPHRPGAEPRSLEPSPRSWSLCFAKARAGSRGSRGCAREFCAKTPGCLAAPLTTLKRPQAPVRGRSQWRALRRGAGEVGLCSSAQGERGERMRGRTRGDLAHLDDCWPRSRDLRSAQGASEPAVKVSGDSKNRAIADILQLQRPRLAGAAEDGPEDGHGAVQPWPGGRLSSTRLLRSLARPPVRPA